jgi:hypothetical protein
MSVEANAGKSRRWATKRVKIQSYRGIAMRLIFALLLVLILHAAEPQRHQLDLEALLRDAAALQKLKILYEPPSHESYKAFFVYGDGSLVWQAYPNRPMSLTDVPTCRNSVSSDRVKNLVRLIIQKHFIDLPEKQFLFVSAAQGKEELELRTIAIDTGMGRAIRTFGIGEYAGKAESIPPDFSSIEEELKQLKDSAFSPAAEPCHLAPAVKFWN